MNGNIYNCYCLSLKCFKQYLVNLISERYKSSFCQSLSMSYTKSYDPKPKDEKKYIGIKFSL